MQYILLLVLFLSFSCAGDKHIYPQKNDSEMIVVPGTESSEDEDDDDTYDGEDVDDSALQNSEDDMSE